MNLAQDLIALYLKIEYVIVFYKTKLQKVNM